MAVEIGDRLPARSWALPLAGLAAYLAFGASGSGLAAAAMGAALLACVSTAVYHAEVVALRVGEPFGTLVLTLAVVTIEVAMIVSVMLTGDGGNPELARDSVHAVVMIVVHGLAGLCIVVGARKHREQEYRVEGTNAFLAVLLPLAALTLVLPNHLAAAPGPYFSPVQLAFVSAACLALYAAFLFVQTVRHRDFFLPPGLTNLDEHAKPPSGRIALMSGGLLVVALAAVVLLAKSLAPFVEAAVAATGAPVKVVGVVIAAVVLLPETAAALTAARRDRLQSSLNLALGSAVATIGLTVPVVSVVSWWTGKPITWGLDAGSTVLLALGFLVAFITYGTGRTNLLSGFVHLVLFATYVFFVFVP